MGRKAAFTNLQCGQVLAPLIKSKVFCRILEIGMYRHSLESVLRELQTSFVHYRTCKVNVFSRRVFRNFANG